MGNYAPKGSVFNWQALKEVKDDTKLYTNRAQTYIKLGKYTEALEDCDWALRVRSIMAQIGYISMNVGRHTGASVSLQSCCIWCLKLKSSPFLLFHT